MRADEARRRKNRHAVRYERAARLRRRRRVARCAIRRRRRGGGCQSGARDQQSPSSRGAEVMKLKAVGGKSLGGEERGRAARPHAEAPAGGRDDASTPRDAESEAPVAQVPVDVRSVALTILAILALILTLQYAQAVAIPIVLGVLISYALEPMVAWLTRWHVPRAFAAAVVLLALTAGVATVLYGLRYQA